MNPHVTRIRGSPLSNDDFEALSNHKYEEKGSYDFHQGTSSVYETRSSGGFKRAAGSRLLLNA